MKRRRVRRSHKRPVRACSGPKLALKADVDRRGAEILLRLFRDYTFQETFVHLAGKRRGDKRAVV
jgi:hypothetical protein